MYLSHPTVELREELIIIWWLSSVLFENDGYFIYNVSYNMRIYRV
jgi:hypothetical protein